MLYYGIYFILILDFKRGFTKCWSSRIYCVDIFEKKLHSNWETNKTDLHKIFRIFFLHSGSKLAVTFHSQTFLTKGSSGVMKCPKNILHWKMTVSCYKLFRKNPKLCLQVSYNYVQYFLLWWQSRWQAITSLSPGLPFQAPPISRHSDILFLMIP